MTHTFPPTPRFIDLTPTGSTGEVHVNVAHIATVCRLDNRSTPTTRLSIVGLGDDYLDVDEDVDAIFGKIYDATNDDNQP